MTLCKNCNKDVNCTCICGFCWDCIRQYSHQALTDSHKLGLIMEEKN